MTDELFEQFLIEARELLQQASDDLLALERDPAGPGRIDSAFRAVHTLKGSVGLFDFAPMASLLHKAEDFLDAIRSGHSAADRAAIDVLLDCVGVCEQWIEVIAITGALPAGAEEQSRRVRDLLSETSDTPADVLAPSQGNSLSWLSPLIARSAAAIKQMAPTAATLVAFRYTPSHDCFYLGEDPMATVQAIPELLTLHAEAREPWAVEAFDPFTCNLTIEGLSAAPVQDVRLAFRLAGDQVTIAETAIDIPALRNELADPPSDSGASTLRVDIARIDAMVDLVGELIVAKNVLAHVVADAHRQAPALVNALQASQSDIDRLVGDLHRAVMNARMLRLDRTFRRLPRVVREIAGQLGKDIQFTMEGGDTEADKTIVDGLFEPLLHLLRNAVDHGIESAQARAAAGKPAAGRVILRAERTTGQIAITISDDGGGIDPEKIRRAFKAARPGDAATLDALDEKALRELIFVPGFSTAATITSLSGRGVGLDVVKATVERLGGRIDIAGGVGIGTTMRLKLPRSFSLTTVIIVTVDGERYGVPLDVVLETARIPADQIVAVQDSEAFVLRDQTIPLLRLSRLLDQARPEYAATEFKTLIVAAGDQTLGIAVDSFAERIEVILRPMTGLLSEMRGYLGTALMGDGRVLMVLDLPELVG